MKWVQSKFKISNRRPAISDTIWKPVERGKHIPADLETSNLHFKTDSVTGSKDKTVIFYYDNEGDIAGGFSISFDGSKVTQSLVNCPQFYRPFSATLSPEKEKEWLIEKRGYRTKVYCNGKEVLDITASTETCVNPELKQPWSTYWGRKVSRIEFVTDHDTASDYYYIG